MPFRSASQSSAPRLAYVELTRSLLIKGRLIPLNCGLPGLIVRAPDQAIGHSLYRLAQDH
jgi:hypothetical protein